MKRKLISGVVFWGNAYIHHVKIIHCQLNLAVYSLAKLKRNGSLEYHSVVLDREHSRPIPIVHSYLEVRIRAKVPPSQKTQNVAF